MWAALIGSRAFVAAFALLGIAAAYEGWAYHQRMVGESEIIQAAKDAGEKANETNEKVRSAADAPGAAERLRRDSCRDC